MTDGGPYHYPYDWFLYDRDPCHERVNQLNIHFYLSKQIKNLEIIENSQS